MGFTVPLGRFRDSGRVEMIPPSTGKCETGLMGIEMAEEGRGRGKARAMGPDAMNRMLALLHEDPGRAEQEFNTLRRKLVKFFEWRGCSMPDDLADESIYRVASQLGEGLVIQASQPRCYFYGVARNVLHEYWDSARKEVGEIDGIGQTPHLSVDPDEVAEREAERSRRERLIDRIESCMNGMPGESRTILMEYFCRTGHDKIVARNQMAQRMNISINALRLRVLRLKQDLRRCLDACANEE